jgi:hypothetical protein
MRARSSSSAAMNFTALGLCTVAGVVGASQFITLPVHSFEHRHQRDERQVLPRGPLLSGLLLQISGQDLSQVLRRRMQRRITGGVGASSGATSGRRQSGWACTSILARLRWLSPPPCVETVPLGYYPGTHLDRTPPRRCHATTHDVTIKHLLVHLGSNVVLERRALNTTATQTRVERAARCSRMSSD